MAQIYVVEDDPSIAELVSLYLRRDGHQVERFGDGAEAWRRFVDAQPRPELIVLDLMLPGLDGRGVARRVRAVSDVPILMVTALDDDRDKIEGLDLGADDYLTKPFNPNVLLARVRAILRRCSQSEPPAATASPSMVRLGNGELDLVGRRLLVGAAEVPLRTKEFDLIAMFAAHPNVVLSRDQLLQHVWGGEFAGDTRTVDVHVSRLRDRLAAGGVAISIDTIRSVGYRLTIA